jgi:hypothetical protein
MRKTCSLEGCDGPAVVRGICNRHYQAEYRTKHPDRVREQKRRWKERTGYAERYNAERRKPKVQKTCKRKDCRAEFETARETQLYCSERCQRIASARRLRKRSD